MLAVCVLGTVFGGKDGDSNKEPEPKSYSSACEFKDSSVEILSAKWTKDYEDKPAVVVTYSFTNLSDEAQNAMTTVSCKAFQNGVELSSAMMFGSDADYEAGESMKDVKQGGTIEVQDAFELSDTAAPVEVEITAMFRDDPKAVMTFQPEGVTGDAAQPDVPDPSIAGPDGNADGGQTETDALEQDVSEQLAEGTGYVNGHYVEIKDAVFTDDHNGNPCIVVTFAWTNNGDKAYSSMSQIMGKAFQNGIEIESALYLYDNDLFDGSPYMLEIKPGATLDVQRAFQLSDPSAPVEFELGELFGTGDKVTKVFTSDGGVASAAENDSIDTSVSENLLMSADVMAADVLNGSKTNVIGQRGYILISDDDFDSITSDMLVEFADAEVDGSGYNWFTIMASDGRGIQFTGANIVVLNVGTVSSDGIVNDLRHYLKLSGDTYVDPDTNEFHIL